MAYPDVKMVSSFGNLEVSVGMKVFEDDRVSNINF